MSERHLTVDVKQDHLERLASCRPVHAVSELIWNSVDADANVVDVQTQYNELGMESITVTDNGHGIKYQHVDTLFESIGGSWKSQGLYSATQNRMLHGKEGRGRLKALALGRVAEWKVVYQDENGFLYEYSIELNRSNMKTVRVSEPAQVENEETGVAVQISELHKHFRSLEDDNPIQELSEIFAIYLTDYPMVSISCNGYLLDPEKVISNRKEFKLPDVETDEHLYTASIEVVEWSVNTERVVYFCSDAGFPLDRVKPRFHTPGLQFSAYLKSEYISELHQDGMLSLGEMDSNLMVLYDRAQEKIKLFHRRRQSEVAQNAIEEWKNEEVYPYEGEPSSPIETAERQVFDILALNIKDSLPGFVESDRRTKKFQFRMLRQAIEKGPEELQNILKEVLDLPVKKQLELARLLKEASLSNVISASRLVSDRLKFIYGLEGMLFEPDEKKHFKERSQLHRILADNNTWVFGEEFSLTVNDQSLTEVLRQHCAPQTELVIDRPVTRSDGRRGIVDLMLTKSVPRNRPEEKEHLIVELKRPSVKIGAEEITQIKSYAFAVAEDERFRHLDTRWTFWLVANDLDPFARNETRQAGRSRGKLYQSEDQKIEIWVKTWSELIEENKSRLRFVEEALNSNIDRKKSLSFLKATYERYLSDHPSDAQEQKLESGNHEGD